MAGARLDQKMRPRQSRRNGAISRLESCPRSANCEENTEVFLGGTGFAKLIASLLRREGHPSSVGRAADS